MDTIQIYSNRVIECAQDNEFSDTYKVKFVICDFSTNHNHTKINRDKIEDWMGTLKNKPVVGKLVSNGRGGVDFSGHNMRTVIKIPFLTLPHLVRLQTLVLKKSTMMSVLLQRVRFGSALKMPVH